MKNRKAASQELTLRSGRKGSKLSLSRLGDIDGTKKRSYFEFHFPLGCYVENVTLDSNFIWSQLHWITPVKTRWVFNTWQYADLIKPFGSFVRHLFIASAGRASALFTHSGAHAGSSKLDNESYWPAVHSTSTQGRRLRPRSTLRSSFTELYNIKLSPAALLENVSSSWVTDMLGSGQHPSRACCDMEIDSVHAEKALSFYLIAIQYNSYLLMSWVDNCLRLTRFHGPEWSEKLQGCHFCLRGISNNVAEEDLKRMIWFLSNQKEQSLFLQGWTLVCTCQHAQ